MEWFITALVIIVILATPLLLLNLYQRRVGKRRAPVESDDAPGVVPWTEVQASDRVTWDDRNLLIDGVAQCREERNHRVFGWLWLLTADGRLLEYRGGNIHLFAAPTVLTSGAEEFEQLAGPRGVLAAYESRSRLSWEPVRFAWHGQSYEVAGTGTFEVTADPIFAERPVWRSLSRKAGDNVYFALQRESETEAPEFATETAPPDVLLGVWTDDLALFALEERVSADAARIIRPASPEDEKPP